MVPTLMHVRGLSDDPPWGQQLKTGAGDAISDQVEEASVVLKEARADIITQSGSPFAFLAGGLSGGRALQARVEQRIGLPFVMMGLAMLNAANAFGYKRLRSLLPVPRGVAPRLSAIPRRRWGPNRRNRELGAAGIFRNQQEVDRAVHPQHSKVTLAMPQQAGQRAVRNCPDAACLFLLGGAIVALELIEALEQDLGIPVIAAANAQFWDVLKRLGIGAQIRGDDSLLESLMAGCLRPAG